MQKSIFRFGIFFLVIAILSATTGFAVEPEIFVEEESLACPVGGIYRPQPVLTEVEEFSFPVRLSSGEEPDGEKTIYDTLLEGCLNHEEQINIFQYNITVDELEDICYNFAMAYPEALVLGCIGGMQSHSIVISVNFQYLFDNVEEDNEARALMASKIDEFCDGVMEIEDPLEQLLTVHDRIVLSGSYDTAAAQAGIGPDTFPSFHGYGFLANKTSVCQGYAQVLLMAAKKLGFDVALCYSDNVNHIWNYIKVNGEWYHMDITWDDPTNMDQSKVYHQYFLCSDETMEVKHSNDWKTTAETMPECNSTRYESGYLFNFLNPKVIEKKNGIYQFAFSGYTFCSDSLWTGTVLTAQPENGRIIYIYMEEPETPLSIYTAWKDSENILRGGGVSTRTGETQYSAPNMLAPYSYTLPKSPAGATSGTIYFRDAATQKPVGPTLHF